MSRKANRLGLVLLHQIWYNNGSRSVGLLNGIGQGRVGAFTSGTARKRPNGRTQSLSSFPLRGKRPPSPCSDKRRSTSAGSIIHTRLNCSACITPELSNRLTCRSVYPSISAACRTVSLSLTTCYLIGHYTTPRRKMQEGVSTSSTRRIAGRAVLQLSKFYRSRAGCAMGSRSRTHCRIVDGSMSRKSSRSLAQGEVSNQRRADAA